jgi:hypothetical protein
MDRSVCNSVTPNRHDQLCRATAQHPCDPAKALEQLYEPGSQIERSVCRRALTANLTAKATDTYGRATAERTKNTAILDALDISGCPRTPLMVIRNQQVVGSSPTAGSRFPNKITDSRGVRGRRPRFDTQFDNHGNRTAITYGH